MSDHPTTSHGEDPGRRGIEWNDGAELHLREDGGGVFNDFKSIRRGTFAELIDLVMDLPEDKQASYSIAKDGDRRYEIGEIRALFHRPDFPLKG